MPVPATGATQLHVQLRLFVPDEPVVVWVIYLPDVNDWVLVLSVTTKLPTLVPDTVCGDISNPNRTSPLPVTVPVTVYVCPGTYPVDGMLDVITPFGEFEMAEPAWQLVQLPPSAGEPVRAVGAPALWLCTSWVLSVNVIKPAIITVSISNTFFMLSLI